MNEWVNEGIYMHVQDSTLPSTPARCGHKAPSLPSTLALSHVGSGGGWRPQGGLGTPKALTQATLVLASSQPSPHTSAPQTTCIL